MDEWWRGRHLRHGTFVPSGGKSAQEIYDEFVKKRLSPALRELGMTGSGGRYTLRCDDCWNFLALQKSSYSNRAELRFTINLMVANKEAWAVHRGTKPHLPARPQPSVFYGPSVASTRIGRLLPSPHDIWWEIGPGVDLAEVSDSVLSAIEDHGLPWLRTSMVEESCDSKPTSSEAGGSAGGAG